MWPRLMVAALFQPAGCEARSSVLVQPLASAVQNGGYEPPATFAAGHVCDT